MSFKKIKATQPWKKECSVFLWNHHRDVLLPVVAILPPPLSPIWNWPLFSTSVRVAASFLRKPRVCVTLKNYFWAPFLYHFIFDSMLLKHECLDLLAYWWGLRQMRSGGKPDLWPRCPGETEQLFSHSYPLFQGHSRLIQRLLGNRQWHHVVPGNAPLSGSCVFRRGHRGLKHHQRKQTWDH